MEMANIREQCTWAHGHDREGALEKAKDLTAAAIAKARFLTPLEMIDVPVTRKALVIGGGVASPPWTAVYEFSHPKWLTRRVSPWLM